MNLCHRSNHKRRVKQEEVDNHMYADLNDNVMREYF